MAISFRAATGLTAGTSTSLTWTLPAGHTTDDLLIAILGMKPYNPTFTATPESTRGYSSFIGGASNGTTANGNGTGSNYAIAWRKTHSGSETAPTGTLSAAPSPRMTAMIALSKTNAGAWEFPSTGNSADTTATGGTLNHTLGGNVQPGDWLVLISARPDDVATETGVTLTPPSGMTVGALTERLATNTTTSGNDGALYVYTAEVTSTNSGGGGVQSLSGATFTATTASNDANGVLIYAVVREPSAASPQTLIPGGIASAGAIGTPVLSQVGPSQTLVPGSVASAEALGTPTLSQTIPAQTLVVPAIASGEALGTPVVVAGAITTIPGGIATGEQVGTPTVAPGAITTVPDGIASGEAVGTPTLSQSAPVVRPDPIASAEALGTPTIQVGPITTIPSGIASAQALGTPTVQPITTTIPASISSAQALGTPTVAIGAPIVVPTGITSGETFGTPTILTGVATVIPTGISSGEAVGTPLIIMPFPQTVVPIGIGGGSGGSTEFWGMIL